MQCTTSRFCGSITLCTSCEEAVVGGKYASPSNLMAPVGKPDSGLVGPLAWLRKAFLVFCFNFLILAFRNIFFLLWCRRNMGIPHVTPNGKATTRWCYMRHVWKCFSFKEPHVWSLWTLKGSSPSEKKKPHIPANTRAAHVVSLPQKSWVFDSN